MSMGPSSRSAYEVEQKRRELFFFSKFRGSSSLCLGIQPTQPTPPEPDIVVGDIGIEITEFYDGDTRKRDETEQQLVLSEAQSVYEVTDNPSVIVTVYWNQSAAPRRTERSQLARQLVDIVISNIPIVDASAEVEQDGEPGCALPSVIDSLRIQRFAVHESNHWFSPRSAFVFHTSVEQLQATISRKNSKSVAYTGACGKLWLLIVAEGIATSSWCELPPRTLGHDYDSIFDSVFFLNLISSRVTELSTTIRNASPNHP